MRKTGVEAVRRLLAAGVFLSLSINAFIFGGPVEPGPLNPFGILFLVLAVVIWRHWRGLTGHYSPALWDGFGPGFYDRNGRGGSE